RMTNRVLLGSVNARLAPPSPSTFLPTRELWRKRAAARDGGRAKVGAVGKNPDVVAGLGRARAWPVGHATMLWPRSAIGALPRWLLVLRALLLMLRHLGARPRLLLGLGPLPITAEQEAEQSTAAAAAGEQALRQFRRPHRGAAAGLGRDVGHL